MAINGSLPKVYLVRHGETAWTISGQHTGRTDLPLTEQGQRDAQALSGRLRGMPFTEILTSPLQRARQTCELAGFGSNAKADSDLTEWDYGVYEGKRTLDILAGRPGWRLFEDGCPGGETLAAVSTRADLVISRMRAVRRDVLVFAHRDILRVLIARWVAWPALEARRLSLDILSVTILGYGHDLQEPVIRMLNDVRH